MFLGSLNKLQKQVCGTIGSSLAASYDTSLKFSQFESSIGVALVDAYLNWFHFLI